MRKPAHPWRASTDVDPASLVFPPGFLFGAATSAHQVEGDTRDNNWAEWEDSGHAARCGRAVDHWRRFEEDLALMRWLGLTAYRFSVEWSRIEPLPGRFDDQALARYRQWCEALRSAGITPMVTLHHFTEPSWVRGGFENPGTCEAWVRFVEHVATNLADVVDHWITINEPVGYAVQGWWRGEWPPGRTNPRAAIGVIENLLVAHAEAYRVIHRLDGSACAVGLAHNIVIFEPRARFNPLDRFAAKRVDAAYNHAVLTALATGRFEVALPGLRHRADLDHVRGTQDFLGLNHYYPITVAARPFTAEPLRVGFSDAGETNDLGWSLEPGSLVAALDLAAPYGLPILVTEHGTCDADDPDVRRRRYLGDSLRALSNSISNGADVRGYFHWALMDNFEWGYGFSPRFGLFRVDYDTLDRTPTSTAEFYRRVIAANRGTGA